MKLSTSCGTIVSMKNMKHNNGTNLQLRPPQPLPLVHNSCTSLQPQLKHPCDNMLGLNRRKDYFDTCVPLYEACVNGDWEAATMILDKHPELVRFAITEHLESPLHVAVSAEETELSERFVKCLLRRMNIGDLELQNRHGNTALSLASIVGNTRMAKMMVETNPRLLNIPGSNGMMPLHKSAMFGKYNTLVYLYNNSNHMTGDHWTDEKRVLALLKCLECEFYDVALKIVKKYPTLAMSRSIFGALARNSNVFKGVEPTTMTSMLIGLNVRSDVKEDTDAIKFLRKSFRDTIITKSRDEVNDILGVGPRGGMPQNPSKILFVAAEVGNTAFVVEVLRAYPDLLWDLNDDNHSIFHVAVMNRHHDIYNLLHEIVMKDMLTSLRDKNGNNMLHLVGLTSKAMRHRMSRTSLLLRRELLWYKHVEKIVPPYVREMKNIDGKTPYELLSEENTDLVSQGQKWMKDCVVVAMLIVTVAFAVVFTVPGGYNQDNGLPIFMHKPAFLVFVVADAVSFFSSSTSLLVFLTILASHHNHRNFMYTLPRKLMIGLVTLFVSVAAMMVTFSASFFVVYHNTLNWVPILIATCAAMPVIIFAILQLPRLVDIFGSIYDSRYFFKPKKRMLYHKYPNL